MNHRVLVLVSQLGLGGAQINAAQLSAAVRRHGFDSVLVGPRPTLPERGGSLLDIASEYDLEVEMFDLRPSLGGRARTLAELARRHDVDLIHTFSTTERPAYWGAGLLGRRPVVRTIYEMSFDPRTHPSIPLIVGTGYLVDELRHSRPGPVTLISPPVDTERDAPGAGGMAFRRRLGLDSSQVLLVIVSRLDEEMKAEGIQQAIRAMGRLADPNLRLLVAGSGDAELRLRDMASRVCRELGWEAVTFSGPLPDPRAAYDAADIVLGMGSSAARGIAFGKPLIVLGEAGWSGIFRDELVEQLLRNSFWTRQAADSDVALAHQIRTLADDPRLRLQLGDMGRGIALQRFSLDAMSQRLADVYREALKGGARKAWFSDLGVEAQLLASKMARTVAQASRGRVPEGPLARRFDWTREPLTNCDIVQGEESEPPRPLGGASADRPRDQRGTADEREAS